MTIQFNYPWSGLDGIKTLAPAEETRLVAQGVARVYTPGMDGVSPVPVTAKEQPGGGVVLDAGGDPVNLARAWSGRGPARSVPSNSSANIGVASSNVTGFRTILTQHPGVVPFSGVWLVYCHYNTATGLTLQAARATSTPQHNAPTNDTAGLVWSALAQCTVNGAALPYTSPAAVAGVNSTIPAVFSTDRIPVASVARTDSATNGSRPLLRVASYINDSSIIPSVGSGSLVALNTLSDNPGFKVGSFGYSGGTDAVTTLGSISTAEFGGHFLPIEVIFDYDTPVRQIAFFGDSNYQGQGTTSNWAGWPVRLMWQCVNDEVPLSSSNYGNAGQNHADSINTAIGYMPVIARTTKAAICIQGWSVNNGATTDAVFAACRARVLKAIAKANENGLQLHVTTTPPVLAYGAAEKARVAAHNDWVRSLVSYGVRVFDEAAIVAPGGDVLPEFNVDGTHRNDLAHITVAAAARRHFV